MRARILFLVKGLGRGGAEQILAQSAPYFDRSHFDYRLAYVLPERTALREDFSALELPVTCLEGGRGLGWVRRLSRLVVDDRVRLIHSHSPRPAIAARLMPGARGLRLVHTEHNLWQRYHPLTRVGNMLSYQRNDHVFVVSDAVKRSIRYPRALSFLSMPPIETLYHGVDPEKVRNNADPSGVREELGIDSRAPIVGTVGNLKVHKGHKYLLEAMESVRSQIPDIRLVVVGQGALEARVRRRARSLGIQDMVSFTGFRGDAVRIAAAFDVFVLSSTHEGLPISLLEAMVIGLPIVATAVGGIPEVMSHEKTGLLVPPRDPTRLAEAILTLLGNERLRENVSGAASRRAEEFHIRHSVARTEGLYEQLLGHD